MSTTLRAVAVAGSAAALAAGVIASPLALATPEVAAATPAATVGTASSSASAVSYHHPLTISGVLTASNVPVSGELAGLQHKAVGSTGWSVAKGTAAKKTGSHGAVSWKVEPGTTGQYRIHYRVSKAYAGYTTAPVSVKVAPILTVTPVPTAPVLTESQITGTIMPVGATGTVYLGQYTDGAWHRVAKTTIEHGTYTFDITPSKYGTHYYRIVRQNDGQHTYAVSSKLTV